MTDINASAIIPPRAGSTNRGYDNRIASDDAAELVVTLETINTIIMEYLTNVIQPTITVNDEAMVVPIMYGAAERWTSIVKHGAIRDEHNNRLLTPLIVLHRSGEQRNALTNPSNKYLYVTLTDGWNPRNAYDKFAVLNKIRPSQQYRTLIVPDYLDLTYDVIIWTEFQEQMDKIQEQINVEAYDYWGNRNDFKFRVSIDEYADDSSLPALEDRVVRKRFMMKVGAYLLPERMVKDFKIVSTNAKLYSSKKIVTMTEFVNKLEK